MPSRSRSATDIRGFCLASAVWRRKKRGVEALANYFAAGPEPSEVRSRWPIAKQVLHRRALPKRVVGFHDGEGVRASWVHPANALLRQ